MKWPRLYECLVLCLIKYETLKFTWGREFLCSFLYRGLLEEVGREWKSSVAQWMGKAMAFIGMFGWHEADNQGMWSLGWLQEALGRGAACSVGDARGSSCSIAHQLRPRALSHSWTQGTGEQHCSYRARILVLCAILHHLVQTSLDLLLLLWLAEDDDKDPGLGWGFAGRGAEGKEKIPRWLFGKTDSSQAVQVVMPSTS